MATTLQVELQGETYKLDQFTQGYIECALWSSNDLDTCEPLDDNYGGYDLAPETIQAMIADCQRFQVENTNDLSAEGTPALDYAGHDFWLTRNGHGAGFWDGDWPEGIEDRLTANAKAFGERTLYVGDDGLIHQIQGC